jgi:hypothetical protein
MKSFKAFCIGTIATIGLATGASAQTTFTPPGPFTYTGPVTVSKGITLNCTLSGTGTVAPAGTATINTATLSGGLCGSISFTGLPYAVTRSGATVTIVNVRAVGITGNCRGNLVGTLAANGRINFANAQIPSDPTGGAPCVVNGFITTTPPIS